MDVSIFFVKNTFCGRWVFSGEIGTLMSGVNAHDEVDLELTWGAIKYLYWKSE